MTTSVEKALSSWHGDMVHVTGRLLAWPPGRTVDVFEAVRIARLLGVEDVQVNAVEPVSRIALVGVEFARVTT